MTYPDASSSPLQTTALSPTLALIPRGFEEAERMAERLSKSAMLPDHFRGKPADVFWAIAYGLELGLTPVASLRAIYTVRGKPGLYADAMVACVLASGKADYFRCVESTPKRAVFETRRRGDQPVRKAFSIQDAESAGLTRQNSKYKTEPERMLEARAKSWLARLVYPDVIHGVPSVEELLDQNAAPTVSYSAPPTPAPELRGSVAPPSPEELQATADALNTATDFDPESPVATEDRSNWAGELSPEQSKEQAELEVTLGYVRDRLESAATKKELEAACRLGAKLPKGDARRELEELAEQRRRELA